MQKPNKIIKKELTNGLKIILVLHLLHHIQDKILLIKFLMIILIIELIVYIQWYNLANTHTMPIIW